MKERYKIDTKAYAAIFTSVTEPATLAEHDPDLVAVHARAPPVVQIVLQLATAGTEFQRLQELDVVHERERVEHIKVAVLCQRERVLHEVHERR